MGVSNIFKTAFLAKKQVAVGGRGEADPRMHPTGAAALPAAQDLEPHALHSMDWLFKKERIYLLAQFWQQVSPNYLSPND